ncbi:response regulator [Natronobiforma cellulositropha]|uniref:response regulator n=1 Tax=Natronobiforma cellulositropha TaxID=1679076 RepID=UPI0021D608FA|nr:response regulator [Natronobiforma cellulositropha]
MGDGERADGHRPDENQSPAREDAADRETPARDERHERGTTTAARAASTDEGATEQTDETDRPSRPPSTPIRVLHVDDDDAFLELAATFVTRANGRLRVETETDVGRVFEEGLLATVECVVSDYDMPPTDGLQFLERVRERWPTMPFILYTGKGSEEIASEAISAGVTDYLQKEVGTDQYAVLANRIVNAVEQRRAKRGFADRERRFQVATTEAFDAIWILDLETGHLEWRGLTETFGFDTETVEPTLTWWLERVHPDDREEVRDSLECALTTGERWQQTYRIRDADGTDVRVHCRGRTVGEGGSEMIGAVRPLGE